MPSSPITLAQRPYTSCLWEAVRGRPGRRFRYGRGNRENLKAGFADVCSVPRVDRLPLASIRGRPMDVRMPPSGGFHRVIAATETHYFHTNGTFELDVPAGAMLTVPGDAGF